MSNPDGIARRCRLPDEELICDHFNSSSPSGHQAAHFMTVEEHLSTFDDVGFITAREICRAADLSLMSAEKP